MNDEQVGPARSTRGDAAFRASHPLVFLSDVRVRIGIEIVRGAEKRELWSDGLPWTGCSEAGDTLWLQAQVPTVRADLWWRATEPEAGELRVALCADEGWVLVGVRFVVRLPACRDGAIAWPFAAGALVPVARLGPDRRLELTYPVYASMQWVDVFGGGRGVYAAAHDDAPYFKHLRIAAEHERGDTVVEVEFHYADLDWPSGKEWASPPLAFAKHGGDWQAGARRYRAWADTWLHRDPVPEWLRRTGGHNMLSFPSERGRVPFRTLAQGAAASRALGIQGIHIADWMEEGFDTFYPAFQPDPTLGGPRALRDAVQRVAADGGWTCLYLNGRLLDPAGPHGAHAYDWAVKLPETVQQRFLDMWERTQDAHRRSWDPGRAMVREPAPFNRDGRAAQEWWGRVFVPVCPTLPAWQQLWLSRLDDLAATIGPQMFQVDQVCGCWGLPCYDARHPHISPALAWSGYKAFTWQMRRRAQAHNPQVGLWTEGVNDILGQAFDGVQANLTFDSLLAEIGDWEPALFRSTFPEYLFVSGGLDGTDRWALAWAIVLGSLYHFVLPEPERTDTTTRRWVRFATRVRTRHWRAFSGNDVFIPEIAGHPAVRVLAYGLRRRVVLAGAPLAGRADPDSDFEVILRGQAPFRRLVRCDWVNGPEAGRAQVRQRALQVRGRGVFVAVVEI